MKKTDLKFKIDHQILVKFNKMTIKIGEIESKSQSQSKSLPYSHDENPNQIPHIDILKLVVQDLIGEVKVGRDMNQVKTPLAIAIDLQLSRLWMTDLQKVEIANYSKGLNVRKSCYFYRKKSTLFQTFLERSYQIHILRLNFIQIKWVSTYHY